MVLWWVWEVAGDGERQYTFLLTKFFKIFFFRPHLLCFLSWWVLWELNQLTKDHWKTSFLLTPAPSPCQLFSTEARGSSGLSQCTNSFSLSSHLIPREHNSEFVQTLFYPWSLWFVKFHVDPRNSSLPLLPTPIPKVHWLVLCLRYNSRGDKKILT